MLNRTRSPRARQRPSARHKEKAESWFGGGQEKYGMQLKSGRPPSMAARHSKTMSTPQQHRHLGLEAHSSTRAGDVEEAWRGRKGAPEASRDAGFTESNR